MTDELKPCPFCGYDEPVVTQYVVGKLLTVQCAYCSEKLTGYDSSKRAIQVWNTRPIEDELNARIAVLETELATRNETAKQMVKAGFDNVGEVIEIISGLEAQLAERDALIERLVEAVKRIDTEFSDNWISDGDEPIIDILGNAYELVTEWQAMKGGEE